MTEVSMWLFPVAIAAVVGLFYSIKFGIRWTWGMAIQQSLILISSLLGFYFLYFPVEAPLPAAKLAGYFTWLAWILFGAFNFGQRIILNQIAVDLSLLRVQMARRKLPILRMVCWGPPAQYWTANTDALSAYLSGTPQDGDVILEKWRRDPRLPSQAREALIGFAMLGRVLRYDWESIIEDFEQNESIFANQGSHVPYQMASRAYAEVGRFADSERCLEKLNNNAARMSATNLDLNFLAFFALAGTLDQTQLVLDTCTDRKALPDYMRRYWLGRCYGVRNEADKAIEHFELSKTATPSDLTSWNERIEKQIIVQRRVLAGEFGDRQFERAELPVVEKAERMYRQLRLSAELVRPAKSLAAVNTMMAVLVVAFIASNPDEFFRYFAPAEWRLHFIVLQRACLQWGELAASKLWSGEWWRMITYLFLHGNTAHLLLNVGALYIFGKSVERMYGTFRFMIIFFVSGFLSGLVQITLIPNEPAIGASGAILGIFGAAIAGIVKLKDVIPNNVRQSELRWMLGVAIAQVLFDQLVNNIAAATDKSGAGVRIAAFAHMGGIVAGFIVGMLLPLKKNIDWQPKENDKS